jgi:steroid 5-alpha reductase family enzyme
MDIFITLLISGLAILGFFFLLWIISLPLKNSSIVDIFWGTGFVIVAWLAFFLTPNGFLPRKIILVSLVTIWGLRLTMHILSRNWGKPEDYRYQKWREESGKIWWLKSFFQVFLLQGILMWIISTPLVIAQQLNPVQYLTILDFLAILIWMIGFFFESMGDMQLTRFKKDPVNKGQVLDSGVWRYTRHPNYFGDSAQWWGYYVLALAAGGWWTIFSPILMTFMLLRVSGVALLEKTLAVTKPQYRDYIEATSSFIPWFPKKKNGLKK